MDTNIVRDQIADLERKISQDKDRLDRLREELRLEIEKTEQIKAVYQPFMTYCFGDVDGGIHVWELAEYTRDLDMDDLYSRDVAIRKLTVKAFCKRCGAHGEIHTRS